MNRFIVAEVSKNWLNGKSADDELLSQKFEAVIAYNYARGYWLDSFQIHRLVTHRGQGMNETIIAVFQADWGDDG